MLYGDGMAIPKSKPVVDESQIRLALAGDQDAYAKLHEQLMPLVRRTSYGYFRDQSEWHDFVYEALAHILMNLGKFKGESKLTTWATRVTINLALMRVRHRDTQPNIVSIDAPLYEDDGGSATLASMLIDESAHQNALDSNNELMEIMTRIAPYRRTLLLDAYYDGSTMPEMANQRGKSIAAVKSSLRQARLNAQRVAPRRHGERIACQD